MPKILEEIDHFSEFVRQKVSSQQEEPSLEECLRQWREEQELAETIADIKASLAEIADGNYTSVEEAGQIIRAELGWPPMSK